MKVLFEGWRRFVNEGEDRIDPINQLLDKDANELWRSFFDMYSPDLSDEDLSNYLTNSINETLEDIETMAKDENKDENEIKNYKENYIAALEAAVNRNSPKVQSKPGGPDVPVGPGELFLKWLDEVKAIAFRAQK